jgi:hypothetical protein
MSPPAACVAIKTMQYCVAAAGQISECARNDLNPLSSDVTIHEVRVPV